MPSEPPPRFRDADACLASGRYADAVRMLEVVTEGLHAEDRAAALTILGAAHSQLGDYAAAERELNEALALRLETLGDEHPDVATTRYNLAESLRHTGRVYEALPLYVCRPRDARRPRGQRPASAGYRAFGIGQCFWVLG
jgi:tetratricopeptide (TPR) repeat protein